MPLGDGLLIDTEVCDDVLGAAAEPPSDGTLLDPPGLIPGDAQQAGGQSMARRSNQAVN